jgi:hypothetical protein
MRLVCTGTSGGARNLNLPLQEKFYVVQNNLVDTVTVKTVAGTGIAVPTGAKALLYCNGTDIINGVSHFSAMSAVSPAFTGTPTAPTAAPGTNTTPLATTGFVTSAINATLFPTGGIIMWSGTIATIPSGWALCNGSNGTPDLRDRFIVGATQDDAGVAKTNITGSLTQTGGSKDAIVVSHVHTGTTDSAGTHQHSYTYPTTFSEERGDGANVVWSGSQSVNTGAAGAHTHTFTTASSGSSGTNANLVPYFALAFIMKT